MAQSADLKAKIEGLNKVFQFYYKENFKTLRKATDFYIPWFIGRKNAWKNFKKQYIPFSVALFLEGVRNSTLKMEGEPNEELIEALRAKLPCIRASNRTSMNIGMSLSRHSKETLRTLKKSRTPFLLC